MKKESEKTVTGEYTIKTFDEDGETDLSPLMSREAVQNWVNSDADGKVFDIVRLIGGEAVECTDSFSRRRFYVEPLSYLTV